MKAPKHITDMKLGQHFKSQSKVQKEAVEYIYMGLQDNGFHLLEAASGNLMDDCEVYTAWFNNRKIELIK